jgi:hypothetical protein
LGISLEPVKQFCFLGEVIQFVFGYVSKRRMPEIVRQTNSLGAIRIQKSVWK